MRPDPWTTWWPRLRDAMLFFGGMAGIAYETAWEHIDRPELLILFGAMVGLPGVVRADAARRAADKSPDDQ